MPRKARIDAPGALHHIIARGIVRRSIFKARSLVCFWAFSEIGESQIELAQKFGISQPAVSSAVRKGGKIAKTDGYELLESNNL